MHRDKFLHTYIYTYILTHTLATFRQIVCVCVCVCTRPYLWNMGTASEPQGDDTFKYKILGTSWDVRFCLIWYNMHGNVSESYELKIILPGR